jgi:hypothetical protein
MSPLFDRVAENAFFVLGLRPTCTRHEVEREGQKLLAMLQLGLAEAASYQTPVGRRPRTDELVRNAMAQLREPRTRLLHELLASLPADSAQQAAEGGDDAWPEAQAAFGYAPRKVGTP